jgi:hypothetical protein
VLGQGFLSPNGDAMPSYEPLDPGAWTRVTVGGASAIVRPVRTRVRSEAPTAKVKVV